MEFNFVFDQQWNNFSHIGLDVQHTGRKWNSQAKTMIDQGIIQNPWYAHQFQVSNLTSNLMFVQGPIMVTFNKHTT
jgi:hypothetical protein